MSNPSFDTGDGTDSSDATTRGTERSTATSGDHAGELPPAEYCARVATRVTVTPRSWHIDDTGTSIDFAERIRLNHEVWACERPGSPLVAARTRWQDAIDVRSFDPVKVKACRYWHADAGIEGAWRLRRPQHERLRERGGYYVLVVYQPLPGKRQRRLRIEHAIGLTPSAVEARCGSLAWRYTEHDTYGWISVADIRWPAVVGDAGVGVRDVFPGRVAAVAPRG